MNEMNSDCRKLLHLLEELKMSCKLIKLGFGSLQDIDMSNNFYHLPFLLMTNGFERFMKCYIILVYKSREGSYPDVKYMKKFGHNLETLFETCIDLYGRKTRTPKEFDFITTDQTLKKCFRILSLFAQKGRYYNFDIIAGSPSPIDSERDWEFLESSIERFRPLDDSSHPDYYSRINSKLIAKLEQFIIAIKLQFTLGDHDDQNEMFRQAYSIVNGEFPSPQDEQFGTKDYRLPEQILQQKQKNRIKRSYQEIVNGKWPTRVVKKDEFGKNWPFRTDHVIVECRGKYRYIVNIDGYDFALNGFTQAHLKIPFPHDEGFAVLTKSIGPFIDLASKLCDR